MVDIVMERLMPWIVMAVSFIIFVIASVKRNNESYDVVQRAIIVLVDEKIEIEVDNYDIDDNIVEIKSIDGRVFITNIKNVLFMSE